MSQDPSSDPPVVHVLVAEKFFWDKVEGTLCALARRPLRPEWGEAVFEQLQAEPAIGMVVDLENDRLEVLPLLRRYREDQLTAETPILAYCSHLKRDLIEAADRLGIDVVPRSTFAANLVRLLMELGQDEENGQPQAPGAG